MRVPIMLGVGIGALLVFWNPCAGEASQASIVERASPVASKEPQPLRVVPLRSVTDTAPGSVEPETVRQPDATFMQGDHRDERNDP